MPAATCPLPPTSTGGYNDTLRWSASWDAWDGAPVDTPTRWRISLCTHAADPYVNDCGSGPAVTVDVTPRRLQQFVVVAGATYNWENGRVVDNGLVASGSVVAGTDGVVTVPNVALTAPAGHRLILQPASPLGTATPTLSPPSPGSADTRRHTRAAYLPLLGTTGNTPTPTSTPTPTHTPTATVHPRRQGRPPPRRQDRHRGPTPVARHNNRHPRLQRPARLQSERRAVDLRRHPLRRHAKDDAQRRQPPARHQSQFPNPALSPRPRPGLPLPSRAAASLPANICASSRATNGCKSGPARPFKNAGLPTGPPPAAHACSTATGAGTS